MVYDVTSNNMAAHPRTFFTWCIGSNNGVTGHAVFKLSTKRLVTTPKYKPKHMAEDIVTTKKDRTEKDVRLIVNTNIDKDVLEDIDELGDKDELHLSNRIADDKAIADNEN